VRKAPFVREEPCLFDVTNGTVNVTALGMAGSAPYTGCTQGSTGEAYIPYEALAAGRTGGMQGPLSHHPGEAEWAIFPPFHTPREGRMGHIPPFSHPGKAEWAIFSHILAQQ